MPQRTWHLAWHVVNTLEIIVVTIITISVARNVLFPRTHQTASGFHARGRCSWHGRLAGSLPMQGR